MSEIELKLRDTPSRLKTAAARLRKAAGKTTAFRKELRAVYFDTAKDDLHAKGLSLRVRDEDGRFVQTLKQTASDAEALTRGEWSDDIAAAAPELVRTKTGQKLKRILKDLRLRPRFRTVVTRHGFLLRPRRGAIVEVVRDEGEICAIGRNDGVIQISEIEIELKSGSPGALYDVALQLVDMGVFRIETLTKSDRGYALVTPDSDLKAVKAVAPTIDGAHTLAEVLRSAARRHFGQFLVNMAGALKQDANSIHQMRVAMRRLRSALYAVRDFLPEAEYESVRLKLKYLLQSLGAARDWEVVTERMSELDEDNPDAPVEDIQRAAALQKRQALVRAVDTLGSRKNAKIMLEAMRWFEDLPGSRAGRKLKMPAKAAVAGLLTALFDRVRRRARHFEKLSVDDRHRLRIACKNLRYNLELFGAVCGKRKVEKFLTQLKPVQDDLGHLNDVSRARELLGALAKRSPQKDVAEAVVRRLESRVDTADKRARKRVAALRDAKPFW